MTALLVGIIFLCFAVYSVLPVSWSLQWWPYVLDFLKGGLPLIALFVGLIALLVGLADIKDRKAARAEEKEEAAKDDTDGEEKK